MSIIEKKEKNLNQLINKLNTLTSTYSQSTYEVEKIITEKNELYRKQKIYSPIRRSTISWALERAVGLAWVPLIHGSTNARPGCEARMLRPTQGQ